MAPIVLLDIPRFDLQLADRPSPLASLISSLASLRLEMLHYRIRTEWLLPARMRVVRFPVLGRAEVEGQLAINAGGAEVEDGERRREGAAEPGGDPAGERKPATLKDSSAARPPSVAMAKAALQAPARVRRSQATKIPTSVAKKESDR
jgi:hypothetical protein